jgi:hypothetical protein
VLFCHRALNPAVKAAIAAIPATARRPIAYPRALRDDQLRRWVSDAEVEYTAFHLTPPPGPGNGPVTARLIVRRVRDMNTGAAGTP